MDGLWLRVGGYLQEFVLAGVCPLLGYLLVSAYCIVDLEGCLARASSGAARASPFCLQLLHLLRGDVAVQFLCVVSDLECAFWSRTFGPPKLRNACEGLSDHCTM